MTVFHIVALLWAQRTLVVTLGGAILALGLPAALMASPEHSRAHWAIALATVSIAITVAIVACVSRAALHARSTPRVMGALAAPALKVLAHVDASMVKSKRRSAPVRRKPSLRIVSSRADAALR
jgi:hypothetical protein